MAIYINGMDIPKDCGECFVGNRTICSKHCPLIEVSEPPANAVEVVRCKDCKNWANGRCWGIPFCGDDASYIETEEHDFCAYGERREDGEVEE